MSHIRVYLDGQEILSAPLPPRFQTSDHSYMIKFLVLFLIHRFEYHPSAKTSDCIHKFRALLTAPLPQNIPTAKILKAVASVRRGASEPDSIEKAFYDAGGDVAIVALGLINRDHHRTTFLQQLAKLPDLPLVLEVIFTGKKHDSFLEYVREQITDDRVRGRCTSSTLYFLLTRIKQKFYSRQLDSNFRIPPTGRGTEEPLPVHLQHL
ncbi:hypothetical protein QBC47DRAFT_36640 [Echria macrotheca]|uniref:Uncharacterized protein n=1 Tax=Echria macrotheca TaxID=438768 RepID=A0AAJ0BC97_9PEZI|nr:hypothetical protein QBC47DRAFT_36640 [Echria macrotheca]